jgi:hypothetical protein
MMKAAEEVVRAASSVAFQEHARGMEPAKSWEVTGDPELPEIAKPLLATISKDLSLPLAKS